MHFDIIYVLFDALLTLAYIVLQFVARTSNPCLRAILPLPTFILDKRNSQYCQDFNHTKNLVVCYIIYIYECFL